MRSRRTTQDEMAEVARRRLELLGAELAAIRADRSADPDPPTDPGGGEALPGDTSGAQTSGAQTSGVQTGDLRGCDLDGAGVGSGVAGPLAVERGRHARRSVGPAARCGGWIHDRLPPTLQGRVRLTSGHLTVVALLVAGAFATTAWWVVRVEGATTEIPAATWTDIDEDAPAGAPVTPETAHASVTEVASEVVDVEVVVDVAGKVRRPGIATLPAGSRVVDALEAAGGARRGVDLTWLNLARVLVDGEQVLVGLPPPSGVAASAVSAPGAQPDGPSVMVNINAATQAELEELPGIGPVTAAAILAWRTDHGAFTAVDELMEVSGIGEATLANIAPFVTL